MKWLAMCKGKLEVGGAEKLLLTMGTVMLILTLGTSQDHPKDDEV